MRFYKDVRGTQATKPNAIEVNVDTAYIRENIVRIEESESDDREGFVGWQYDETQYGLKEYIQLIGGENEEFSKNLDILEDINVSNMMAMAEMYEEKLILEENNTVNMLAITELYELLLSGGE